MKNCLDLSGKQAAADKPRRPRVTALLNAGAILAAAIASIAASGPKLPPTAGD